jgi:hypothetical protein
LDRRGERDREPPDIAGIAGSEVTLDAPLADSLDQRYLSPPGPKLVRYTFSGRIEEVGIESMRLVAPEQAAGSASPQFTGIRRDAVQNGFVRDVVTEEFGFGMSVGDKSKWITIQDSAVLRTTPVDNSSGYPFQFVVTGQLILLMNCRTSGDDAFAYVTQARVPGPNVVLGLTSEDGSSISPHQRWATGLLVDSSSISGRIDMMNRGYLGSGHGWTMGLRHRLEQQRRQPSHSAAPRRAQLGHRSIGTVEAREAPRLPGGDVPNGIYDSHGKSVPQQVCAARNFAGASDPKHWRTSTRTQRYLGSVSVLSSWRSIPDGLSWSCAARLAGRVAGRSPSVAGVTFRARPSPVREFGHGCSEGWRR